MASTDPVRRAIEQQRDRVVTYRASAHQDVERYSQLLQEAIEAAAYHGRELAVLDAFLAEQSEPEPCPMAPYARDETGRFLDAAAITERFPGIDPSPTRPADAFAPMGR